MAETSKVTTLQAEVSDLTALLKAAKTARAQKLLQTELAVVTSELQTETEKAKTAAPATTTTTAAPTVVVPEATPVLMSAVATSAPKKLAQDITKYAWDQSATYVKIYATLPDGNGVHLTNDMCELNCQEKSFCLVVHAPNGKDYRLTLGPLGGEIRPSECTLKAKDNGNVVVSLRKASSASWANVLFKKDDKKIPEVDKEENPEAGLMKMMQKLYEDGDDDMKRMMQKAFHENRSGKKPDFSADPMGM